MKKNYLYLIPSINAKGKPSHNFTRTNLATSFRLEASGSGTGYLIEQIPLSGEELINKSEFQRIIKEEFQNEHPIDYKNVKIFCEEKRFNLTKIVLW